MAPKDQCWAEVIDRQAWLEEHRGGVRLSMLEILHGVLNCPEIDGGCLHFIDAIQPGVQAKTSRSSSARPQKSRIC